MTERMKFFQRKELTNAQVIGISTFAMLFMSLLDYLYYVKGFPW